MVQVHGMLQRTTSLQPNHKNELVRRHMKKQIYRIITLFFVSFWGI